MTTRLKKLPLFLVNVLYIFFILTSIARADSPCEQRFARLEVYKKLKEQNVKIENHLQQDFPAIRLSSNCYLQSWPENTEEIINIIKTAYHYNLPIRTQGSAHSQNGLSLPKYMELLINTSQLNLVTFKKENTVTVGAGLNLFLLQEFLKQEKYGYLPVINGGGPGPTVGGFISSGGIGITSRKYGGFWENVEEIVLISGDGKLLRINNKDPLFPWLFGSVGQFGVIVEATLKMNPPEGISEYHYPQGKIFKLSAEKKDGARWIGIERRVPMYWVNLFVGLDQVKAAEKNLKILQNNYSQFLDYHPTFYYWPVKYGTISPPLIFSAKKDFMAMGFFGYPKTVNSIDYNTLWELEREFGVMVIKNHYGRYLQAELSANPKIYKEYLGEKKYEEFKAIKNKLDPKFLFNRSSIF